jgi:hypothetical protein
MPAPSSTVCHHVHTIHRVWDDHVPAVPDLLRGEDSSRSAVTYGKECAGCNAMAASRARAPVRGGCCHRCGAVRADADDASQGSSAGRVIAGGLRRGRGCRLRGAAGTPFLVASSLAVFTFVLTSGRSAGLAGGAITALVLFCADGLWVPGSWWDGCTPGDYRATALAAGSLLPRTGTPS